MKLAITWKAIARGGEVKFLSYKQMFFDEVYNMLFTQWFQRKTLKSTPIGFAAEFEHPESCVHLALGCYWAVERGFVRNVVGEPGTPQDRRLSFFFQTFTTFKMRVCPTSSPNKYKVLCPLT